MGSFDNYNTLAISGNNLIKMTQKLLYNESNFQVKSLQLTDFFFLFLFKNKLNKSIKPSCLPFFLEQRQAACLLHVNLVS